MRRSEKKENSQNTGNLTEKVIRGFDCISVEQLMKMKEVDIRTVDKSQLVEISEIEIDTKLPDQERMGI